MPNPPPSKNDRSPKGESELHQSQHVPEWPQRTSGDIPVPPKYTSADFAKGTSWALSGKLDVPKERFVSFPFVTGADAQTMIAWAGLDHLQLAKAIGDF